MRAPRRIQGDETALRRSPIYLRTFPARRVSRGPWLAGVLAVLVIATVAAPFA